MGTNYYRIPSQEEMLERKELLIQRAQSLDISSSNIAHEFRTIKKMDRDWDAINMWEDLTRDMLVHLGKRSGGWKFLWNFHNDQYYQDKEELLKFIRSGRVVDEYYKECEVEWFIEMALSWGQPDGLDLEKYGNSKYSRDERYVDGLRVSGETGFS